MVGMKYFNIQLNKLSTWKAFSKIWIGKNFLQPHNMFYGDIPGLVAIRASGIRYYIIT